MIFLIIANMKLSRETLKVVGLNVVYTCTVK